MESGQTSNGKKGGLFKGKTHAEGGIKAVVVDTNEPIEVEKDEVIITAPAVKDKKVRTLSGTNAEILSKINQSGGGVPIPSVHEYKYGGPIVQFNPNKLPASNVVKLAATLRSSHPEIWNSYGKSFENEMFEKVKAVSSRGYWTPNEKDAFKVWQMYGFNHKTDHSLANVISMLKCGLTTDKGYPFTKQMVEQITKGVKVEKEHTKTIKKLKNTNSTIFDGVRGIAEDHLEEDSNYYTKLHRAKLKDGGPVTSGVTKIYIDKYDRTIQYWAEEQPDGKWIVYSASPRWSKRDEDIDTKTKEDAELIMKQMANITPEFPKRDVHRAQKMFNAQENEFTEKNKFALGGPIGKKYYIFNNDTKSYQEEPLAKKVKLSGIEGDFFSVKDPENGYVRISEGKSGLALGQGAKTLKAAILQAEENISKYSTLEKPLESTIQWYIDKNGLSPRYSQSETKPESSDLRSKMTKQEFIEYGSIGFDKTSGYKASALAKARKVMDEAVLLGYAVPYDFGRGKGKYKSVPIGVNLSYEQIFSNVYDNISADSINPRFEKPVEKPVEKPKPVSVPEVSVEDSFSLNTPTGERSRLTYLQQVLVRTQAFKNFFGDWETAAKNFLNDNKENYIKHYTGVSMVTDGTTLEPKLLFHGTKAEDEFFTFEVSREKGMGRPYAYFAVNKEYSKNFTEFSQRSADDRTKALMYSCFLNVRKPFMALGQQFEMKSRKAEDWKTIITGVIAYDRYGTIERNEHTQRIEDVVESQIGKYIEKTLAGNSKPFWYLMAKDLTSDFKFFLISHGYDGIFYTEEIGAGYDPDQPSQYTNAVCIFQANDIKLADGRNLNFDPMKSDIRFDKGGPIVQESEPIERTLSHKEKLGSVLFGKQYAKGGGIGGNDAEEVLQKGVEKMNPDREYVDGLVKKMMQ